MPSDFLLSDLAEVTVYADGTVIVPGPQAEIFPPPALRSLLSGTLSKAEVAALLDEAEKAGLTRGDRRLADDRIADAPSTRFLVRSGGKTSTVDVYALHESESEITRPILEFEERVLNTGSKAATMPYTPDRIRLVLARPADQPSPEPGQPPELDPGNVPWPLTASPDEFGQKAADEGFFDRCGVVQGKDLLLMRPALENSNTRTHWTGGSGDWLVIARPLLPGEPGCEELL